MSLTSYRHSPPASISISRLAHWRVVSEALFAEDVFANLSKALFLCHADRERFIAVSRAFFLFAPVANEAVFLVCGQVVFGKGFMHDSVLPA
jgi:hypothetical protein